MPNNVYYILFRALLIVLCFAIPGMHAKKYLVTHLLPLPSREGKGPKGVKLIDAYVCRQPKTCDPQTRSR